jgi:hypothetical protein
MALVVAGLPVEGAGVHVKEAHELLNIEDGLAVVVGPPACSVMEHELLHHGASRHHADMLSRVLSQWQHPRAMPQCMPEMYNVLLTLEPVGSDLHNGGARAHCQPEYQRRPMQANLQEAFHSHAQGGPAADIGRPIL